MEKKLGYNAPLCLPEGSVRAILAVLFVATYCIGGLMGVDVSPLEKPVYAVMGIYFAARVIQHVKDVKK